MSLIKQIVVFLLIEIILIANAYAAPEISFVNGNIINTQQVSITGNNFGTKPNPAPIKWDNFENGENNAALCTSSPEWHRYGDEGALFSTTDVHAGSLSVKNDFSNGKWESNYYQFRNILLPRNSEKFKFADGFTSVEMDANIVTLKFDTNDCDTRIISIITT